MEVLRSIQQLEAIRDEWNALADVQGHALLRHEWLLSAARTLHGPRDFAVVCIRRSGQLEAAAPLVAPPRFGVGPLQFVGAAALHEPNVFLARDGQRRAELLEALVRLQRPLALQRLTMRPDDLGDLRSLAQRQGFLMLKPTSPALGLTLRPEVDGSSDLPSGRLRYDIRRARARAGEHGDVRFEVLAPRPNTVDEALDTFVRVEASSWKGREGSALAERPRLQAFFRTYCRLAAESGILRIFFLRIGSRIAAAQIAAEVYRRLWILKIGYDEALARCSPGFLLNAEAIRYAGASGLSGYEFLGSAEPWERRWQPEERPTTLAVYYPFTVRGCLGASVHLVGSTWRRMQQEIARAS